MRTIVKERVLRINCPGFGDQSYLSTGCALPLQDYDVIVVNPMSILHLFDKDPELLKQIEIGQQEGMTAYVAKSDKLVESVACDLETRSKELVKFLESGGLLVYFLCPPFVVQGPFELMDNYGWLDALAPDKPKDKKDRHMSSASHGKNIDLTSEGETSPFANYLKQTALEWNTIIRAENLSPGYSILATAGPNKCIAGCLNVGEQGGMVVFLPAPYQSDFDQGLVESIRYWYTNKGEPTSKESPIAEPSVYKAAATEAESSPAAYEEPVQEYLPAQDTSYGEPAGGQIPEEIRQPFVHNLEEQSESETKSNKIEELSEITEEGAPDQPSHKVQDQEDLQPLKAKDLMEKMEEISRRAVPEWCVEYSFADLDKLRKQLVELNEEVRLTQAKIVKVEEQISTMEWLKNSLLSAEDDELMNACTKVFEHLGWTVMPSESHKEELWLKDSNTTVAIARIIRSTAQVNRSDLAQLAESVITYWGEHETEPKGILVASTWANRSPAQRTEVDYTDALSEFAEKKNLCLMTTWQLLCIYRDIEGGQTSQENLKETIASTKGRLSGFVLGHPVTAS
ncbi:MAG: hypothetical protein HY711_11510 [Candidatus Melainabacteria bacterium]|nr:hypothetical protein [Candidatus Melainabacteria bacterium]